MSTMNTVAERWTALEKAAMPPGVHPTQVKESKRMFYAGAAAILDMQLHVIAHPSTSELAGVQMLQGLHEECTLFMAEIMAGRA